MSNHTFTVTEQTYDEDGNINIEHNDVVAQGFNYNSPSDHIVYIHFYDKNGDVVQAIDASRVKKIVRQ